MIIYSQKYLDKYNQITKHYKDLDLKKSRELYTESHHIIPRCLGGSNEKDNLVRIPARVHFLLHWMLYKIYKTPSLAHAWNIMTATGKYTSQSFAYARLAHSQAMSNRIVSPVTRAKISLLHTGKIYSIETKEKIGAAHKGKSISNYQKEKISSCFKVKPLSDEHKNKIRSALKLRSPIECPHCGKIGGGNMKRWHFSNCKSFA